MNKYIVTKFKFLALFFLSIVPAVAWGQEVVRTIELEKTDNVIIRDIDDKEWLVSGEFLWGNQQKKAFVKVDETGTSAPIMFLPDIVKSVNDFEIYEDFVYFCGENSNGLGVVGRFRLSDFPTAQVCVWSVPALNRMKKLDVKEMNSTLHVVMTGETALNSQHLVDAWEPSASSVSWVFYITEVNDDWLFDDVAITDTKVVFSGRNVSENHSGFIYYVFPVALTSVFMNNADYKNIPVPNANSEIWIKPSVAYNFIFATGEQSEMLVGEYNANLMNPVWQSTVGSYHTQTLLSAVDLAFNKLSNRMDFIAIPYNGSIYRTILHPTAPTVFAVPSSMFGRYYPGDIIQSLDGINTLAGCFVAAGVAQEMNHMRVYKYKYNEWLGCLNPTNVPCDIMTKTKDKYDILFKTNSFSIKADCAGGENADAPVTDECIH